jgi:ParB-like chromosome segregation protein Spo0J
MSYHDLHPEDVKAALKKRYGTVVNFEKVKDLPKGGVNDVLRGRPSKRVEDAIDSALMEPLNTQRGQTAHPKNSAQERSAA